jgi:protein involved in sex pheromone biosynthesis
MADRHRIHVVESHAGSRESIEMGRFVGFATVATENFLTNVVSHDEKDIGLLSQDPRQAGAREKKDREQFFHSHIDRKFNGSDCIRWAD